MMLCRMLKISLVLCAIIGAFVNTVFASSDGYPDMLGGKKIIFDPSKCSQDPHGMTYVAIGKTVLHHPSNKIYDVSSSTLSSNDREILGVAKNPHDPEGCPGNPMQRRGAYFFLIFTGLDNAPSNSAAVKLLYERELPESYEYTMNGELSFDTICKNPDHTTDDTVPELSGCIHVHKEAPEEINIAYQSKSYLTPTGRKFALECEKSHYRTVKGCQITYKINNDIRIRYSFQMETLPIANIIAFDKKLVADLKQEEVVNYPWVRPPTDEHNKNQEKTK